MCNTVQPGEWFRPIQIDHISGSTYKLACFLRSRTTWPSSGTRCRTCSSLRRLSLASWTPCIRWGLACVLPHDVHVSWSKMCRTFSNTTWKKYAGFREASPRRVRVAGCDRPRLCHVPRDAAVRNAGKENGPNGMLPLCKRLIFLRKRPEQRWLNIKLRWVVQLIIITLLWCGFKWRLSSYGSATNKLLHAVNFQLMDEVPMIYGTAVIGYCVYQVSK